MATTLLQRFWNKIAVDEVSGCWLWTGAGARGKPGYGFLYWETEVLAHRVSWIMHNGLIPDRLLVLHRCDIRNCVNPSHLFLGTQRDNVHDMIAKDRAKYLFGENNPSARLTTNQVAAVIADARPQDEIALAFGINQSTVSRLKAGKRRPKD